MKNKLFCNHEWRRIEKVMGETWTGRSVEGYIIEPNQVYSAYGDDYLVEPNGDRWER